MQPELLTQQQVAVAGPTAVGKSELGLRLAERLGGAILCADSRQIYRDLDLGTAKPSVADQQRVPHRLFDIADPRDTFTVSQYDQAAEQALAATHAAGQLPIVVGGTGLYFRTLLYDYTIPEVAPQPELRAELEARPVADLHRELVEVDPVAAARIHPRDQRRLVRALEVFLMTDIPISAHQQRALELQPNWIYVAVTAPKELLWKRIAQRIAVMVKDGLPEELEALRARYGRDLPLLQTLNYAEIGRYLDGEWDLATAQEQMLIHTRQYAKRQLTWFKRDPGLKWFEISCPEDVQSAVDWVTEAVQRRQA
ncbi:MAG: tRNA (adenosine(37)-N6)-dimethylallyltransferase MiaA [Candidatus Sericytochromatia bacterium]